MLIRPAERAHKQRSARVASQGIEDGAWRNAMGATNARLFRFDGRPPSKGWLWLSLVALWLAWCRRALRLSVANHFDEGVREQDPRGTGDQNAGEGFELASRVLE